MDPDERAKLHRDAAANARAKYDANQARLAQRAQARYDANQARLAQQTQADLADAKLLEADQAPTPEQEPLGQTAGAFTALSEMMMGLLKIGFFLALLVLLLKGWCLPDRSDQIRSDSPEARPGTLEQLRPGESLLYCDPQSTIARRSLLGVSSWEARLMTTRGRRVNIWLTELPNGSRVEDELEAAYEVTGKTGYFVADAFPGRCP